MKRALLVLVTATICGLAIEGADKPPINYPPAPGCGDWLNPCPIGNPDPPPAPDPPKLPPMTCPGAPWCN